MNEREWNALNEALAVAEVAALRAGIPLAQHGKIKAAREVLTGLYPNVKKKGSYLPSRHPESAANLNFKSVCTD